jgi:outer membrane protein assembly factor BamB
MREILTYLLLIQLFAYSDLLTSRSKEVKLEPTIMFEDWALNLNSLRMNDPNLVTGNKIYFENQRVPDILVKPLAYSIFSQGKEFSLRYDEIMEGNALKGYVLSLRTQDGQLLWKYSPYFYHSYGPGLRTALVGKRLVIAVYHPFATGSDLLCVDFNTGKEIWHAQVNELMAEHSEYYNHVWVMVSNDRVLLAGKESDGNILQVFSLQNGSNLFTIMRRNGQ